MSEVSHKVLAQLCADAYKKRTISRGDTEVLIDKQSTRTVFAFRGTTFDYDDILSDVAGWPDHNPVLGWCHDGFLEDVLDIWHDLQTYIPLDGEIVFTGHSKGGAEAVIAAALTRAAYKKRVSLVTFGCPGVGMARLRRILSDARGIHYRNGADCVPSHPLWPRYPGSDYIDIGPARTFWRRYVDVLDRFHDHRIAEYVKSVPDTTFMVDAARSVC